MDEFGEFIEVAARGLFKLTCHQDPALLMEVDGGLIPLCPRCMGLHEAFFVCMIIPALARSWHISFSQRCVGFVLLPSLMLMPLHWLCVRWGLLSGGVESRLLTGMVTGLALGLLTTVYRQQFSRRPKGRNVTVGAGLLLTVVGVSSFALWVATHSMSRLTLIVWLMTSLLGNLLRLSWILITRFRALSCHTCNHSIIHR